MNKWIINICFWFALLNTSYSDDQQPQVRIWRDITGKYQIRAALLEVKKSPTGELIASLKKTDGRIISVPVAKLSRRDQARLQEVARPSADTTGQAETEVASNRAKKIERPPVIPQEHTLDRNIYPLAPTGATAGNPEVSQHAHEVVGMAFLPDGRRVVTGAKDGVVLVWDVASGRPLRQFAADGREFVWLSLTTAGNYLFLGSPSHMACWDFKTGAHLGGLTTRRRTGFRVSRASHDGRQVSIASGSDLYQWDTTTGNIRESDIESASALATIQYTSDNTTFVYEGHGDDIRLARAAEGVPLRTIESPASNLYSIALSRDDRLVAGGTNDGIMIWSIDGKALRTFEDRHRNNISAMSFNHDASRLISVSHDMKAMLWNVEDGSLVCEFTPFTSQALSHAQFTPDGASILIGSRQGKLALFNTAGELVREFGNGGSGQ